MKGWNYGNFERLFLKHIEEVDWAKIAGTEDFELVKQLRISVAEAKEEIKRIDVRIENLMDGMEKGENLDLIGPRLTAAKTQKSEKLKLILGLEGQLLEQVGKREDILGNKLKVLTQSDDYHTRLRLRAELKKVIKRVDVYRFGMLGVRGYYTRDPAIRVIYANGTERVAFLDEGADQSMLLDAPL